MSFKLQELLYGALDDYLNSHYHCTNTVVLIYYFRIDQAENTEGEYIHLTPATSIEVKMISPQPKALLQPTASPSLPYMLAPLPPPRASSTKLPSVSNTLPSTSELFPSPPDTPDTLSLSAPPLPPSRQKSLATRMNPCIVIPKRFVEDTPKTCDRKNQAVCDAVLLCVVIVTVPTVHWNFFSGGSQVSINSLLFVNIN